MTNFTPCATLSLPVSSNSLRPHGLARQAPLSVGVSRQEYWSGLPFTPPGDLPSPGIEPRSPTVQADSLPGKTQLHPSEVISNKSGLNLPLQTQLGKKKLRELPKIKEIKQVQKIQKATVLIIFSYIWNVSY